MISTKLASIGLAVALAAVLPAIPAQATSLTRTFVSSAGSDSNPCTITQPCATFAHAYSLTLANGIIAALDPGKYGPLTISGPITVNGNGWAAITAPAAGIGITINAVSGNVALNGLEIDGAGAAYNGIVFNSGSNLTVTNCTVQNFLYNTSLGDASGNGIIILPTSGTVAFTITDTTASNNGNHGIAYRSSGSSTANGIIHHVVASNNVSGIFFDVENTTGAATFTISNSVISNDSTNGISITSSTVETRVSIDNVIVASDGTGIIAGGNPNVLVGRSVITNNNTGIENDTSPNNFYTYQDNRIDFNSPDTTGGMLLHKGVQ